MYTQADLALLKAKKGLAPSQNSAHKAAKSEKRYLILTHEGEFDKVHYPLPMTYTEEPDMQAMFNTF